MNKKKENLFHNRGLQPDDYYINENGMLVFTENYHLKRGYCCGNRCKHCPYGHKNTKYRQ